MSGADVIWHDLECGSYRADLSLWRGLATRHPGTILDVGAGTGRVTLELAHAGHPVIALDRDPELLAALTLRAHAASLATVRTVLADACDFTLAERVALCIVPMQTVQLLADGGARAAFLRCAARALMPGGRLAVAIADVLEPFEVAAGSPEPLPDVGEFDGIVYSSRPLAVRVADGGFVLERRREMVTPAGTLHAEPDFIRLESLDPELLKDEGRAAGFTVADGERIGTTADHVGSAVVMLDAPI